MLTTLYWIAISLIILVVVWEFIVPRTVREGFESGLVSVGENPFWAKWAPRRGDIGVDPEYEESGYKRDQRQFAGYVDIQRIGQKQDFCRVVYPTGSPGERFVACGLGGTDGLSTVEYRSPSEKDGFRLSRDDYMHDVNGDGRDDYCRILKTGVGQFEVRANICDDNGISGTSTIDPSPPEAVEKLLRAYSGALWWYRFMDDMVDYAGNLDMQIAGQARVEEWPAVRVLGAGGEEAPKPSRQVEGLELNGMDQFVKIGERPDMEFGQAVAMRTMRAFSVWVRFDEFTNNAHIFDFGNGAGKDNVWLGILGRGNSGAAGETLRPLLCGGGEVVPEGKSGAQPVEEWSPRVAMEDSAGNVDKYDCPGPSCTAKPKAKARAAVPRGGPAETADLVYEVWDATQRVMRIKLPNAIVLGKWTHICVTADSADSWRPNIEVYINGKRVTTKESGFLPQTDFMKKNYIGKSNWADVTSQYENKDELFRGAIFDFRGYQTPMSSAKVRETVEWGKKFLGLSA
jgi:hypothetical protein